MSKVIYKIFRVDGGPTDCYVGSSIDVKYRWQKHRAQLRGNYHDNIILQRAWNKYGESNFELVVIENHQRITEDELIAREQHFIDTIKPRYNIAKVAGRPPVNPERSRHTALKLHAEGTWGNDTKPVIRIDPVTKEKAHYASQTEAAAANNCLATSISKCCLGQQETHHGYSWQFADGSTPKFTASSVEKPVVQYNLITGKTLKSYRSAKSAATDGYSPSAISQCAHGFRHHHHGYGWKFADGSSKKYVKKSPGVPVIGYCLKTGRDIIRFNSMAEASSHGYNQSKISLCCNQKRQSHSGLGWRFESDEPRIPKLVRAVKPIEKVDLKTNQVLQTYDNAHLTKKDGFNPNLIRMCLYGKRRSHQGFGWRYVGDTEPTNTNTLEISIISSTLDGKLVKTYSSLVEVKMDGHLPGKVSECCRGKRKTHHNLKWSYREPALHNQP